ncbi:MAG: hypothetical protein H7321_05430 [Bacteroidia bacterium]|nr:hypothetical protein [Bacteroidia bacterium]
MQNPTKSNTALRWATFIVVILNIAFNYLYAKFSGVDSVKVISDKYDNLFTPAPYAFAIWGIIYLSFIIYCITQLLPRSQKHEEYELLSGPLLLANIGGSLWIFVYTNYWIGMSVVVIFAMLILGMILFIRSYKAAYTLGYKVTIPFALFFGWISVAVIASVSSWLVSIGWNGAGISETVWTVIMITVATIAALITGISYKDPIFPAVVAWATIAIKMKVIGYDSTVELTAMVAAIITGITAIIYLIKRLTKKTDINLVKQGESVK